MVTGSYPPDRCGVGDYTAMLTESLARKGIDVVVLTTCGPEGEIPACAHLRVLRRVPAWGLRQRAAVLAVLHEERPDIIHVQYPTQGYEEGLLAWAVPVLARLNGFRGIVQTWHEPYRLWRTPRLLLKSLVVEAIVSVRPDLKAVFSKELRWVFLGKRLRFINSAPTIPRCVLPQAEKRSLRERYLKGAERLIVFFGFVYPHKRVELLFDLAVVATDRIVIAGQVPDEAYLHELRQRAAQNGWQGRVDFLGFVQTSDVAALLAVADAVVLPFQSGGGDWNTSILAANQEGVFVLTTSTLREGYDAARNTYFAAPDAVEHMREALATHGGERGGDDYRPRSWDDVAEEHLALYEELLA